MHVVVSTQTQMHACIAHRAWYMVCPTSRAVLRSLAISIEVRRLTAILTFWLMITPNDTVALAYGFVQHQLIRDPHMRCVSALRLS